MNTSQSDKDRQGVDGIGLVYDDDDVAAGEFPDAVVGVVHVSALLMSFRTACTLKTHNLCIRPRDLIQSAKNVIIKQCKIVVMLSVFLPVKPVYLPVKNPDYF